MIILVPLLVPLFEILGGLLYRIHGGLIKGFPRWLSNVAFSFAFALPTQSFTAAAFVFLGTLAAVATGHGRWQSLKEPMSGNPEKMEFLIQWVEPHLPVYWYKVLGMFFSGCLIIAPLSIAAESPLIFLCGGIMKSSSYIFGWDNAKNGEATRLGEFLTGMCFYALIAALMIL